MEDSIFTKIIKGEIPCYKVYEDDTVFAMLDIDPLSDGHVLVFPKKQVDLLWDLDQDIYNHLMDVAKIIAEKIQNKLNPLRVGMVVEGFGVPHAHIHLVPLYDKDVLQLHHGYHVRKDNFTDIASKINDL